MSKVVRLSDIMIETLENYRKFRIERSRLLLSCCSSYLVDIERYENMSYSELLEDSILSAYVSCKMDVEDLSKIHLKKD